MTNLHNVNEPFSISLNYLIKQNDFNANYLITTLYFVAVIGSRTTLLLLRVALGTATVPIILVDLAARSQCKIIAVAS